MATTATTLIDTVCGNLALCGVQTFIFSHDGSVLVFKDANTGNVVFLGESKFFNSNVPLINKGFTDKEWTHWVLRALVRRRSALNIKVRREIMLSSNRYSIHGKSRSFDRGDMRNYFGVVGNDYQMSGFLSTHDNNGYHNSLG